MGHRTDAAIADLHGRAQPRATRIGARGLRRRGRDVPTDGAHGVQDVEDQLAAQSLLAQQLNGEDAALASAQRTLDISNNRYKAGVDQYLDVITAQTAALAHEQSVIQLNGQRLAASVSLIKSLGAGWKQPSTTSAAR